MKRKISLLIAGLLLVGFLGMSGFAYAQPPTNPYVRVIWNVADQMHNWSHTQESSQWVFGPQPSITIEYAGNDTSISNNNYHVEIGTLLHINIVIPKSFIGVNNALDAVHFWGNTWIPRSPIFALEYNATADHWNYASFQYRPGVEAAVSANFINMYSNQCEYIEEIEYYQIVFAVEFTDDTMESIFWTGMQAVDTAGRPVTPSWLASQTNEGYESPPIGVQTVVSPRDFALQHYYYADIVDTEGKLIHYVDDGDIFIVRMMSTTDIAEVMIPFAMLTWNASYQQNITYSQPLGWPNTMFNADVPLEDVSLMLGPQLYMVHNASGTFWEVGYPDISFEYVSLTEDIGSWVLHYGVEINRTIDLNLFFTEYTVSETLGVLQWGGSFTDACDMDSDPFKTGDVLPIAVQDNWMLGVVNDAQGKPIYPRDEIFHKQTLRLSYKENYVEAFVFDNAGNIVEIGEQGENLNLTMVVHRPIEYINGTLILTDVDEFGNDFLINHTLKDFTLAVSADGTGRNETHHWRVDVVYNITVDFDTNLATYWSAVFESTYLTRTGALVDFNYNVTDWWTVNDWNLNLGESETVLSFNVTFSIDAPSMILKQSRVVVGLEQDLRIWNSTGWGYPTWIPDFQESDWNDLYYQVDLSSDIVWSPSHFRLGQFRVWAPPAWTITEDGAIDLDGNTYTTEDQYFIKRTGYWHDWGNTSVEGMAVIVGFDPVPDLPHDEFVSSSWMGVAKTIMEFEANETFYWYHADNFTLVPEAEMNEIRDLLWADEVDDIAAPEYEHVAWLSMNRTIELKQWTGLDDNVWTNTWFAWGTVQAFNVAVTESSRMWASFRAEYAGLLVFTDKTPLGEEEGNRAPDFSFEDGQVVTDEVTHVVLIDDIGSLDLRRPLNSTEDSGDVFVDPDTVVTFGISIYDVEVCMYPLQIENSDGIRGPWAFRESYEGALGLNETNFDYWITHATVDEMAFDITFTVDMVEYDAEDETTWNHAVSFKIDQAFGEWDLDEFDNSVLLERGLAVNFFGKLTTAERVRYNVESTPVTDTNEMSVEGNFFEFGAADSPFANVTMGGLPFITGLDNFTEVHYSGSSSAPIGAFNLMYESDTGNTITGWNIESSMLFMTAGYPEWGGNAIICDPVFVAYTSSHNSVAGGTTTTPSEMTSSTTAPTTTTSGPTPSGSDIVLYILVGGIVVVAVIACVAVRRRQ